MAQHDMNIANQGFPAFRADLNDALGALVSNSSGATAPTTTFAHQFWVDTSVEPNILRQRNADNDAWIVIGSIDQVNDRFVFLGSNSDTASLPSFSFNGDPNTGMFTPGADQVALTTGGTARLTVTTAQFTGTLPWRGQNGTAAAPAISASGDTNTGIYFPAADSIGFVEGGAEVMRITSAGYVGIGTTTPGSKLAVNGVIESTSGGIKFPDGTTQISSGFTPAGTVITVAMNTAPTGYLKANGAAVSRTTYADLFAAIGTTFGAGNGSTTFNLPDLRGEFIRGWDDGRGVDSGRAFGSAQLDQMQRITGQVNQLNATGARGITNQSGTGAFVMSQSGASPIRDFGSGSSSNYNDVFSFDSANSPDARVSSTTSGETRSRNVALLACIKF